MKSREALVWEGKYQALKDRALHHKEEARKASERGDDRTFYRHQALAFGSIQMLRAMIKSKPEGVKP